MDTDHNTVFIKRMTENSIHASMFMKRAIWSGIESKLFLVNIEAGEELSNSSGFRI